MRMRLQQEQQPRRWQVAFDIRVHSCTSVSCQPAVALQPHMVSRMIPVNEEHQGSDQGRVHTQYVFLQMASIIINKIFQARQQNQQFQQVSVYHSFAF